MSEAEKTVVRQAEGETPEQGEATGKAGWLSWSVGWVLMPATVLGLIFGGGALVGAHFHDSWLARLVVWTVELFS